MEGLSTPLAGIVVLQIASADLFADFEIVPFTPIARPVAGRRTENSVYREGWRS